ncbi:MULTISPECIES: hypothetical protein [Escherichia]|uniref:hypothetical protein n=1 Tax=Escherichia TaxID=561 RepID=UPI0015933254|nr:MULTISPECIES: hypothetical protein [Escherichia]MBB2230090.1 hypothetical protein [Escherichia sp. 79.0191]MCA2155573.1 hypothetical protein [Escherichia coli]MCA2160265.1 hypothetical protein [Escherichia coli]MCZ5296169.1 hypothetical protein [Escherichia coli]MCZ6044138.1 hypothetical protein [Escherichia coli]
MKKNIISAVIAGAFFAVAGSAMAAPNEATDTATVTTSVLATSAATVSVTANNGSVSVDDITTPQVEVASVDVSASGLYAGDTGKANLKLSVDQAHFAGGQYWKMVSDSGESFKVYVKTDWQQNGDNITLRTDGQDSVSATNIVFATASGNNTVSPGDYTMPVTLSFNTW